MPAFSYTVRVTVLGGETHEYPCSAIHPEDVSGHVQGILKQAHTGDTVTLVEIVIGYQQWKIAMEGA